jgi:hypothetical protein
MVFLEGSKVKIEAYKVSSINQASWETENFTGDWDSNWSSN